MILSLFFVLNKLNSSFRANLKFVQSIGEEVNRSVRELGCVKRFKVKMSGMELGRMQMVWMLDGILLVVTGMDFRRFS